MNRRTPTLRVAALAIAFAAVLAACGSEGSSTSSSSTTSAATGGTSPSGSAPGGTAPAGDTIASTFTLGGPAECPERPLCQLGLEETYGLAFADFKALDALGPLTVAALANDDIQVAVLLTTDGNITANGWVLLEDDKGLQPAENVTPVFNEAIATEYGDELETLVDGVSEKITTEDLTELNQKVTVDKEDAADVAREWVDENASSSGEAKTGSPIVVGSANFDENAILAEIYAAVLEDNGYPVERKLRIGSREVYFPALERGEVSLIPEYTGSLLTFLDTGTDATSDNEATYDAVVEGLDGRGVVAFAFAPAEDKNGFVVTKETAEEYSLSTISDLAKPAP